ncbi:hypothetical protein BGZ96_009406 [Linnemannia gamsii]|uniref:Uncharacterized protein n=1 Tax=Linnemannia gamsii TaxID=64522 RepID=A0ABQ7KFC8_9FUNG|nr:hypothetical protein BGZ96_009406 [Linnemannia gamsii]
MVVQFETYKTQFTALRSDGTMDGAKNLTNLAFVSPRLFSLSGYFGAYEVFNVFTNFATNSAWMGVRFNYTNGVVDQVRDSVLTNYPTRTPLFTLGTLTSSLSTTTQGYSIVFDTTGQGQAYPALGNTAPVLGPQDHILSLGSPYSVNLNGVSLTMDAVPVTMANIGYILDKGSDGSTVVYSIIPDQSSMLHRVSTAGGPPFSPFMAATALNKQIVTYSSNSNSPLGSLTGPTLNIFDTVTGIWSGPGLMDSSSPGGGGGGIKYRVRGSQQVASSGSGGGGGGTGMQSYRSGGSSATRSQVDRKSDRKSGF